MSTAPDLFTDASFDPREPARHRAGAGIAFEKHRWTVPTRLGAEESIYRYSSWSGHGHGADGYAARALPNRRSLPVVEMLAPGALPAPPLHVHVLLDETGSLVRPLYRSLTRAWLVFADRTLRRLPVGSDVRERMKGLPSSEALALYRRAGSLRVADRLASVAGIAWEGAAPEEEDALGMATLSGEDAWAAAVGCLREVACDRAYLLLDPEPLLEDELRASSGPLCELVRRLTRSSTPDVSYPAFHHLVNRCACVVTTHRSVAGASPYCFYSATDQRPALRQIAASLGVALRETERTDDVPGHGLGAGESLDVTQALEPEAVRGATTLSLEDHRITRLDGLVDEVALKELSLDGLGFLDVRSLARLRGVEVLLLEAIPRLDVAPLAGMERLRRLSLQCEPRGGWGQLQLLTRLESLQVFGNFGVDTQALSGMANLREIFLDSMVDPVDLAPLGELPALASLHLSWVNARDQGALGRFTGLRELRCIETGLTDLAPLGALQSLSRLMLSAEPAVDLGPLHGLTKLESVTLFRVPVPSIAPLAGLPLLSEVRIGEAPITELSALRSAPSLRVLALSRIPSHDVGTLGALAGLRELALDEMPVADLSWLPRLGALEELTLWQLPATDYAPVLALPSLRTLTVPEGRVPESLLADLRARGVHVEHVWIGIG